MPMKPIAPLKNPSPITLRIEPHDPNRNTRGIGRWRAADSGSRFARLGLTIGLAAALQACGALEPITRSDAAPRVDAALGQAVRAARTAQTLNPQAGQDPLLPQEVNARSALARAGAPTGSGTGGARGERAGAMHEPGMMGAGSGWGAGH